VLQVEDSLRLVRVEFGDVKRDAESSTVRMTEAADKMSVRVNSIAEEVHSWDKSVDAMRADVDRLEAAFKRVQFELLNSESRGTGGGSAFAAFASNVADARNPVAPPVADDDDNFRPRQFGARSQPLLRTAEADAALAARRKQQQQQQQQQESRGDDFFDDEQQQQQEQQQPTTDESEDDIAAAKAAAARRAALQEHGIRVIMEERERKEREAREKASGAVEQKK
jgi:hypothetical protein